MKCPICADALARSQYEGLVVFKCRQCVGYLVQSRRVDDICRRDLKSLEELQLEVKQATDNQTKLRCPRCHRLMRKERHQGKTPFVVDRCVGCEWVWFDPGELAQLQIKYEETARGQDAARFRERLRQMTPEQQRRFEFFLSALPQGDSSLASAFGDGVTESLRGILF